MALCMVISGEPGLRGCRRGIVGVFVAHERNSVLETPSGFAAVLEVAQTHFGAGHLNQGANRRILSSCSSILGRSKCPPPNLAQRRQAAWRARSSAKAVLPARVASDIVSKK
jgi:hypothetical protein